MHIDLSRIDKLTVPEQQELLKLVEKYSTAVIKEKAESNFLDFVEHVWPEFISGTHHKMMAEAFQKVIDGKCRRLIINMPPRHTKSEFASVHLPAYFLGKFPKKKIIQCSHTAELAVGFGRRVRDLFQQKEFQDIFPNVSLKTDSKAAGRWNTSQGGDYFAIGVEGAVTGKGADLLIIDDPHSEQEAAMAEANPEIYDKTYEWYTSGPRQRLQPGGAIIIVMTRWSKRDLTARVIDAEAQKEGGDKWEVIEFPAILPSGNPLWPQFWPLNELQVLKNELPVSKWNAQYQQNPTSEEGALIKREWWKPWKKANPPICEAILCSMDTAFTKTERSDYSACVTFGVFKRLDEDSGKTVPSLILLDAWRDKLAFPELKARTYEHHQEWDPDIFIIEGRAAGKPLIYELRSTGVPVSEYNPVRGNDKISRVNSVTDIFASGNVWYPEGRRWAEEVIEECAEFPAGYHDDFVDCVSQALLRYRQGGWISNNLDDVDDEPRRRFRRKAYY